MNHNKEELEKAFNYWHSFKQEILFKNRFIIKHKVLDYLKLIAEKSAKLIEEGTILYRARIYSGDTDFLRYLYDDVSDTRSDLAGKLTAARNNAELWPRRESGFWGFNREDSFIPPSNDYINDGRANPAFIKYLYTAEDPYTALVEVRPYLNSKVSIAEIKVNDSLEIADFSYESFGKFEGFEQILIYLIINDFSIPSDSNLKDYIPTQYIAEFIKTLGFDGIKFNSSLSGKGRNITIFRYGKCDPIGSKLYEIEDICFEAKGLAPKSEKSLMHSKMDPYKNKFIGISKIGLQS